MSDGKMSTIVQFARYWRSSRKLRLAAQQKQPPRPEPSPEAIDVERDPKISYYTFCG